MFTSRPQGEGALFLVVKVVQVVFPCVHVLLKGRVVTCCKMCSSCFPSCPRVDVRRMSREAFGMKKPANSVVLTGFRERRGWAEGGPRG